MRSLKVIQSPPTLVKGMLLRVYRLGVLAGIVGLVYVQAARIRIDADSPISITEARVFFPTATTLATDTSDRLGLFVRDASGRTIGYVLRTSPWCDKIVGYSGPTDTLIALDGSMKIVGIRVRKSADTKEHVADVKNDEYFMSLWTDKTWDQVAEMSPQRAGIEGVSGASLTSLCIANSIHQRFRLVAEGKISQPPARWRVDDWLLIGVILFGCAVCFTRLRARLWLRRVLQFILIAYVGLLSGQLVSQSQLAGWAASGVPWRIAPGFVLLTLAALLMPWTTRRPLYCSHLCPHGAAQEWFGRLVSWRIRIPGRLDAALRWVPFSLLAAVLAVSLLNLPFDLAAIEPFDAYLPRTAGTATILVAVAGLAASLFVPMGYCKYGCPTGALLGFMRSHGAADRFSRRDAAGALLLALAWLMQSTVYPRVHQWVFQ